MGTEILRPQDLLAERFRDSPASFHHRRKYYPATGNGRSFTQNFHLNHHIIHSNTNNGYRNNPTPTVANPIQRKKSDDFKVVSKHTKNNMNQNNEISNGKVMILRRGASLDSLNEKIKKPTRVSGADVGPEMLRLSIPDTMYAGSAFSVSPSPSDLPLPTFFTKHQSFDDSASKNLRRLLRLE